MAEIENSMTRHSGAAISDGLEHPITALILPGEGRLTPQNEQGRLMENLYKFSKDAYDSDGNGESDVEYGPDRPEGWMAGTFSMFQKVVKHAKGAASKPVVKFIQEHLGGTKLIFVVGQSGTGKSTLLSEISGQDLHIGHTYKSGTKNYLICPAIIDGEQYLFVDTAGFGAHDINDMDNFHDIITCIDALGPFVTFAGVLFVYGGTQERMSREDMRTIQWVKCFCGPDFYSRITIVTTKWDASSDRQFQKTWDEKMPALLSDTLFTEILEPAPVGSRRYHGGHVYHHGLKLDPKGQQKSRPIERYSIWEDAEKAQRAAGARSMISSRYNHASNAKLQVVREMAEQTAWYDTEAAKVLAGDEPKIWVDAKNNFARVSVPETAVVIRPDHSLPLKPRLNVASPSHTQEATYSNNSPNTPRITLPSTRSWYSKFFQWVEVAKEVAMLFFGAKRITGTNGGKNHESSTSWSSLWGKLGSWWSGSPPDGWE